MLTMLAAGSGDGKNVAGLGRVEKCCRLFAGEWMHGLAHLQDLGKIHVRAFVSTLRF